VRLDIVVEPPAIPPDRRALARVRVQVRDADGEPVLDGTRVTTGASAGVCEPRRGVTRNGEFLCYYTPPERPVRAGMIAVSGGRFGAGELEVVDVPDRSMAVFLVTSASTEEPLAGVRCTISIGGATREVETAKDGWFLGFPDLVGRGNVSFRRRGYHDETVELSLHGGEAHQRAVSLRPVLDGVLHGKVILLDARFGGEETGEGAGDGSPAAAWNLKLARTVSEGLRRAGADPVLIREGDETVTAEERVERANRHRGADLYLRLAHGLFAAATPELAIDIYPGSERGGRIAFALAEQASAELGIGTSAVAGVDDVEIHKTRMQAVGVEFRTMDHPVFSGRDQHELIRAEAGAIVHGLSRYYGWSPR
jgi:N-acetylmuramoyl-L-alanine amidase